MSKGLHLPLKCWHNQNGCQQRIYRWVKNTVPTIFGSWFKRKQGQIPLLQQEKGAVWCFLFEFIGKEVEYGQMWKRIQFILAMFHGQADVGRGFNVNKELLVENMHEASTVSSLLSQRQILDWQLWRNKMTLRHSMVHWNCWQRKKPFKRNYFVYNVYRLAYVLFLTFSSFFTSTTDRAIFIT